MRFFDARHLLSERVAEQRSLVELFLAEQVVVQRQVVEVLTALGQRQRFDRLFREREGVVVRRSRSSAVMTL